jgi:hypothetical protein
MGGAPVVEDRLGVTIGPFAGGASRIEERPLLGPSLDGANQAGVLVEGHLGRIAPDLVAVWTLRPFGHRTVPATDVLAAVGLGIVPVGAAQPPTGRIRGAVGIIAARSERLRGEGFLAGIIGDKGDAAPAPDPLVVLDRVIASICQLDLLGPERDGKLRPMGLDVAALRDIGRLRGGAHRPLQPPLEIDIRGRVVQVAEDAFFRVRLRVIEVIPYFGLQVGGDLGTAAPQLALRALGEVGPVDAQGRELVGGQGEQRGELRGASRLGTISGQIVALQERDGGLAGLALLTGGLEDRLDDLGERAAALEPLGPGLQLATQLLPVGFIQRELPAGLTEVGTALEPGAGGLQLAIGGQPFARDEAEGPEELHHDGEGGLDGGRVYTAAEVAQIVRPRHGRVQPRELPRATALLRRAQIRTEAGIIGGAIHPAGHLQETGASGIVAVAAFLGIVGGKERAGEAQIDRRADQPTESPLDRTFGGEFDRARSALVVREPALGGLREGESEGLRGVLVQWGSFCHKRLQIKGREVLLGQRKCRAAHGGSSSETGEVFGLELL